jgi:hypothetical protein
MVERDDPTRAPGSEPADDDPDAPASESEVAASQRLRDALEGTAGAGSADSPEIELAMALRSAWDPSTLSVDESRAVLDAAPSAEEQAAATALRDALSARRSPRPGDAGDYVFAVALRAAFAPAEIDEAEHRAIVDSALGARPARVNEKAPPAKEAATASVIVLKRRATVVRVAFGAVAGGLALAASIVFVVTSAPPKGDEAPLAMTRTTQPLFSEPFKPGETSARIDRIASARASDFRDNRFTKWGVR